MLRIDSGNVEKVIVKCTS